MLKSISSNIDDTVPALRAITVRDLLTDRMGFGSVMAMPETYPIQKFVVYEPSVANCKMLPVSPRASWFRRRSRPVCSECLPQLIREYRMGGDGPMLPSQAPGMDEWLQTLGSLPLLAQPGERWIR